MNVNSLIWILGISDVYSIFWLKTTLSVDARDAMTKTRYGVPYKGSKSTIATRIVDALPEGETP